jgi:hypothetical protein
MRDDEVSTASHAPLGDHLGWKTTTKLMPSAPVLGAWEGLFGGLQCLGGVRVGDRMGDRCPHDTPRPLSPILPPPSPSRPSFPDKYQCLLFAHRAHATDRWTCQGISMMLRSFCFHCRACLSARVACTSISCRRSVRLVGTLRGFPRQKFHVFGANDQQNPSDSGTSCNIDQELGDWTLASVIARPERRFNQARDMQSTRSIR